MKHQFDFKAATREFVKEINKEDHENFFSIDVKTLQLRWTDIEIRNHRLGDSLAPKKLDSGENLIEDDLPPLEETPVNPATLKGDQINSLGINTSSTNRGLLTPLTAEDLKPVEKPPNRPQLFYSHDDSSDEED